jgi:hypothetical protein
MLVDRASRPHVSGTPQGTDRSLSGQVQPRDLLCLRLLTDGAGGVVASDGILVPRLQRRHLLDLLDSGDGVALLRWIVTPPSGARAQRIAAMAC